MFIGPRKASRAGLKQTEVLIGVAVVIGCAMIAWPVLRGATRIHHLRTGSESVAAVCNEARMSAIGTAQIYAFRYKPESRYYLIEAVPPADPEELLDLSKLDEPNPTGDLRPDAAIDWEREGQALPDGVVFVTVEDRSDSKDAGFMLNELLPGNLEAPKKPLLFYPNGTTTNATIILHNDEGYYAEVVLDGEGGTVSVSEPYKTKTIGGEQPR
jgi:hypothetical protein